MNSISKSIVHIATDEKFIDAAYEIYEQAFPRKNLFIIIQANRNESLKHLDPKNPYRFVYDADCFTKEVIEQLRTAKVIVFHSLTPIMAKLIFDLPENIQKVWSVFGIEVYDNPYIRNTEIYGKKTFRTFFGWKKRIKTVAQRLYHFFLEKNESLLIKRAMNKIDYVSTLIDEEYELYKRLELIKEDSEIINFTYYPMDIIIDKNNYSVEGNNILLGNSASFSNNHLELFDILQNFDLGSRKIITPLSYGSENYAETISEIGNKTFGESFEPLTEFLPLRDYQKILKTCNIVIMNHYRQQAVGNILTTLFMGAKIFLSKRNTVYPYLKRIGCQIYSIEEDLKDKSDIFEPLSTQQKKTNRHILLEKLSFENICEELQNKLGIHIN